MFVDEIHRFNKAQQDAFLPRVEAGDIVLIGATTENPSFEVNAALLSRSKVFVLQPLDGRRRSSTILRRALADAERGLGATRHRASTDEALAAIAQFANGDARVGAEPARVRGRRGADGSGDVRAGSSTCRSSSSRSSGARCSTTRAARSTTT